MKTPIETLPELAVHAHARGWRWEALWREDDVRMRRAEGRGRPVASHRNTLASVGECGANCPLSPRNATRANVGNDVVSPPVIGTSSRSPRAVPAQGHSQQKQSLF